MNMKKAIAEFIGTFALVLVGCGAAVIAWAEAHRLNRRSRITFFGLAIVAMAYGIGQVSGCHINPAVSFGVLVAGRMTTQDFITYVIAQILGAIAAAVVLYLIMSGKASGWNGGLGQNGWGPGYLGEYNCLQPSSSKWWRPSCSWSHPRRHPARRAGRACGPCYRAHARRDPSDRHQHHRHIGESCPLARAGYRRRRGETGEACASLAFHRRAADRRRHRRLSVQVRHPRSR